jgi:hypothetical protein
VRSSRSAFAGRTCRTSALIIAAVGILCGSAVPASGAARLPTTGPAVVHNPTGRFLGAAEGGMHRPSRARRASAVPPVTYHGGPVMHSSGVFAIFWVPPSYQLPPGYQSTITQYFADVAHDSFLASNVFGVDTQYYDATTGTKKFASYSIVDRGSNVDTHPFPTNGCPNYTLAAGSASGVCLTDSQIRQEISSVIASHKLPTGLGNDYFVFTPPGVTNCETSTASATTRNCFDPIQQNGYCAYHSFFGSSAQTVLYSPMAYEAPTSICWSGESPNGTAGDSVLNNVAHEQNETITDPLGTGWYDSAGNEIADKCDLTFGTPTGSNGTSDSDYNQVINGHGYWLQEVWSNRGHACVQRNTFPQPAASFTYSPTAPVHGRKVSFAATVAEPGATRFTYRWTFPNGGTASTPNPTHRFATPVFVGIVTLIVSDSYGDQTRIDKAITVT